MKLETRILLFYLGLEEHDKTRFKSLVGPRVYEKMASMLTSGELDSALESIGRPQKSSYKPDLVDYDIAIMQLVRLIVTNAPSNIELADSIRELIGRQVSRPEKRSKYELQGMLLESLMDASKERLVSLRNRLTHGAPIGKSEGTNTNLDKWFSIILGNKQ